MAKNPPFILGRFDPKDGGPMCTVSATDPRATRWDVLIDGHTIPAETLDDARAMVRLMEGTSGG